MSKEDEILKLLKDISRRLRKLEGGNKLDAPQEIWLNEAEAMQMFICSKRKLWEWRKSGKIDFKCRHGGKNRDYRYLKSSLEALYD